MKTSLRSILMTADATGGVWAYSLELARSLGPSGVSVTLALMGPPASASQRRDAAGISNLDLIETAFRLEWMEEPWEDVSRAGDWLLGLEEDLSPDVVHLNGYAHASAGFKAPVLIAAHSCVLSWWEAVKGGKLPEQWERYREEVSKGIRCADMIVAPTNAMLRSIYRNYYVRSSCRVICNGRSPSLFSPGPKEPFVFTAGRLWDEAKNIRALSKASAAIPWPVYAAGEGKSGREGEGIESLGRLSEGEVADHMSRASIFALPALYEPFGLSILEAALSGCALVLGDIPSLREIWGDAAIFVEARDTSALGDTIGSLIRDRDALREFSARAFLRARNFTPAAAAAGYISAYERLLMDTAPVNGKGAYTRCVS